MYYLALGLTWRQFGAKRSQRYLTDKSKEGIVEAGSE